MARGRPRREQLTAGSARVHGSGRAAPARAETRGKNFSAGFVPLPQKQHEKT